MELKQFYSNRTSYHLTSESFNLQNFKCSDQTCVSKPPESSYLHEILFENGKYGSF